MAIFEEKFIFTNSARSHLDPSVASVFDDLVKKWDLFVWEDALLFQLYPITPEDILGSDALADVDDLIKTLRGEDGTQNFSQDELDTVDWQSAVWYEDKNVIKRIYRTVYFCLNKNKNSLAMDLRFCLDPVVMQKSKELPAETKEIVFLVYNTLCLYFFQQLPDKIVYFLFESGFVILALRIGFKLEDIIREATDRMVAFDRRNVFCLEMAASLADNPTQLGEDVNHESKDVKYWIDNFRIYSQSNFGGSDLLNFAADKNYFGGCTGADRELIMKVLEMYTHLINGYLAVPGGDMAAVDKRLSDLEEKGKADNPLAYFDDKLFSKDVSVEDGNIAPIELPVEEKESVAVVQDTGIKDFDTKTIKKIIISEFGYSQDGQFEDVEAVVNRLQELASDYNNPTIADLYYFDEQSGEFKWRE